MQQAFAIWKIDQATERVYVPEVEKFEDDFNDNDYDEDDDGSDIDTDDESDSEDEEFDDDDAGSISSLTRTTWKRQTTMITPTARASAEIFDRKQIVKQDGD